ncbi:MAG TPA: Txe/YoeB family addiction module toxin [Anaerolineae bacterium]|nr:Txe/YoeB family addiction module toxin [Anaerolineae bacterium]
MKWKILIEDSAEKDLVRFRRRDRKLYTKCFDLIRDIAKDPRTGIGKPERLRYHAAESWSRRVSEEHRLIYWINSAEQTVIVTSCYSHYGEH